MLPRVSESKTPNLRSAEPGPWIASTSRFLARISARAIRQSFSALVLASSLWVRASTAALTDWRYCQIEVAISPAMPMTKLERKLEYFSMNRPRRDENAGGGGEAS